MANMNGRQVFKVLLASTRTSGARLVCVFSIEGWSASSALTECCAIRPIIARRTGMGNNRVEVLSGVVRPRSLPASADGALLVTDFDPNSAIFGLW